MTSHGREDGFALVTTLWLLALVGLVAVLIEGWISAALDRATTLQQRIDSDAALASATDRLIFALVTGERSYRGLELVPMREPQRGDLTATTERRDTPYVALDGRPYRIGDIVARLQDEAGLYDLSNIDRSSMERLLGAYGVTKANAEGLELALTAYEKRPGNARDFANDGADYHRAGLPMPRHARLLTPWEPYRVRGWAQQQGLWRGASSLPEIVTTGPIGNINVNTASPRVLVAAMNIGEREAARIVAMRTSRPLAELSDLPTDALGGDGGASLGLQPSNIIRLSLTAPADPLRHIVSVRLAPSTAAPYRIDYALALPQTPSAATDTGILPPVELPTETEVR